MFANGNNGPDVGMIFNAVLEASKLGVDPRVILCIIMQESHGNIGEKTTFDQDGGADAGIMQCRGSPGFEGKHSPEVTQVGPLLARIETIVLTERSKTSPTWLWPVPSTSART